MYVTPGCFAHPKCQAFWLGGVSGGYRVRGRWTVPRRSMSPGDAGWGTPPHPGIGRRRRPIPGRCGVGQTRKRVCEMIDPETATERGGRTPLVRRVSIVVVRDMILEQVHVEKRLREVGRPKRQLKLQSLFH